MPCLLSSPCKNLLLSKKTGIHISGLFSENKPEMESGVYNLTYAYVPQIPPLKGAKGDVYTCQ